MNNSPVNMAQALGAYGLFVIMSFAILFSIAGCGVIGIAACEALSWFRMRQSDRAATGMSASVAQNPRRVNLMRVVSH